MLLVNYIAITQMNLYNYKFLVLIVPTYIQVYKFTIIVVFNNKIDHKHLILLLINVMQTIMYIHVVLYTIRGLNCSCYLKCESYLNTNYFWCLKYLMPYRCHIFNAFYSKITSDNK